MGFHSAVLPVEFVMTTVRTMLYSKTAMGDMVLTVTNVTAVEFLFTIVQQTTLLLKMELYMVSVHAAEYVQRNILTVV